MKNLSLFFSVMLLIAFINSNAQNSEIMQTVLDSPDLDSPKLFSKGSFFVTPYYQFSRFKNLKLISHSNQYNLYEGNAYYDFPEEEISEYNDNFDTEYTNSLAGIRLGYHVMDGLGVNAFVGVNHFNFKSWISEENTQSLNTKLPALTFGATLDYIKQVHNKLYAIGYSSVTYSTTANVVNENSSGEDVIKSHLKSLTWDVDIALAYAVGRLKPYAGAGFTQQYINTVTTEQIETTNENGSTVFNKTTFDSHFRGNGFYGFAGIDYVVSPTLSFYARGTFVNPLRITTGIRIAISK